MELASDLRPTVGLDKGERKMLARVDPPIRWPALWTAVVDAVDAASDARPVSPDERELWATRCPFAASKCKSKDRDRSRLKEKLC